MAGDASQTPAGAGEDHHVGRVSAGELSARQFSLPARGGTKHWWQRVAYNIAYPLYALCGAVLFRPWAKDNFKNIPRTGPALLLCNHISAMDPAWTAFHTWRYDCHFMASSTLFSIRALGPLIQSLGAFPKAKATKDRDAMALTNEIYDRGGIVVMFPEGERTWDGRTVPVLPGMARMLKRKPYRIVTARNLTGYFFQPRWAKYPRWVPIRIEYDPPRVFDVDTPEEVINAEISRAIHVDMEGRLAPPGSFGIKLAHGLPSFLWACPSCFAPEALQVDPKDDDAIVCTRCGRGWTVDISCRLLPRGGGEPLPIYKASDLIAEHLTVDRLAAGTDAQGRRIVLEAPEVILTRVVRGTHREEVCRGQGRLVDGHLVIFDPSGRVLWEHAVAELLAVNLDVGSQLFLRLEDALYRWDPVGQSAYKWALLLRSYQHGGSHGPRAEHSRVG